MEIWDRSKWPRKPQDWMRLSRVSVDANGDDTQDGALGLRPRSATNCERSNYQSDS